MLHFAKLYIVVIRNACITCILLTIQTNMNAVFIRIIHRCHLLGSQCTGLPGPIDCCSDNFGVPNATYMSQSEVFTLMRVLGLRERKT